MVGPGLLSFNIASLAVSTAVPGVLWAVLFGLAWRRPAFAESLGLGRAVFWLLLPGALLASFAILPIAPVASDIIAVSFAGAVFPLGAAIAAYGDMRLLRDPNATRIPFQLHFVLSALFFVGVALAVFHV